MQRRLDFTLTINGPFLTRSGEPGDYGLDAVAYRESDGRLGVPKTLLVGKLREAAGFLESLDWPKRPDFTARLAGIGNEDRRWGPSRRSVYLSPVCVDKNPDQGQRITQVAMDRYRRAASDRMLLVMENVVQVGDEAEFVGAFEWWEPDQDSFDEFQGWLAACLRAITQLGGERTSGFGELSGVSLSDGNDEAVRLTVTGQPSLESGVWLRIRPLEPFTVTARNVLSNLFESSDVIPGGVVKGAIATMLAERGAGDSPNLAGALSRLRISHAFPTADSDRRPVVAPLSLAWTGAALEDMALQKDRVVVGDRAPAFIPDWKGYVSAAAASMCGWPEVHRRLIERHEHELATRTARDERVFAVEQTLPGDLTWVARLELPSDVPEKASDVLDELRGLLRHGLFHLGKGHALANVDIAATEVGRPYVENDVASPVDGYWVVTLMSQAILLDPSKLGTATDTIALLDEYSKAWSDISDSGLRLSHFFARQSLAGGKYLRNRFQAGLPYHPYVLTEPGSVFVFESADADLGLETQRKILEDWIRFGLPFPTWARDRYKESWQTCPYVRENGYGEVAAGLALNRYRTPSATTVPDNAI